MDRMKYFKQSPELKDERPKCDSTKLTVKGKAPHSDYTVTLKYAATAARSLQERPTLCDPIDGSPPGSPVPGILQARTLEWVAISFSSA